MLHREPAPRKHSAGHRTSTCRGLNRGTRAPPDAGTVIEVLLCLLDRPCGPAIATDAPDSARAYFIWSYATRYGTVAASEAPMTWKKANAEMMRRFNEALPDHPDAE